MPSANAFSPFDSRRTSFIRCPLDDALPWFLPETSFVVFAPCRHKRPRRPPLQRRGRSSHAPRIVNAAPWQAMAGNMAVVADLSQQAASAARKRDPKTFDRLMDAVRVALLNAIETYNCDEALQ